MWRGCRRNSVGRVTDLLAQLAELPTLLVVAVLGGVMLLDTIPLIGVLVPGDVAVLGAMAARGPAAGAWVLFGVVAGNVAGWSATFGAGRYFGPHIRCSRLGVWIGEARWQAAERAVRAGGVRMVMVAPFLPVLNALVPLAAGGLRMSYRRFLASAAMGGALWAGCYVGLGTLAEALGDLLPGETSAAIASVGIGLAFGWVVLFTTRRRLAPVSAGRAGGDACASEVQQSPDGADSVRASRRPRPAVVAAAATAAWTRRPARPARSPGAGGPAGAARRAAGHAGPPGRRGGRTRRRCRSRPNGRGVGTTRAGWSGSGDHLGTARR